MYGADGRISSDIFLSRASRFGCACSDVGYAGRERGDIVNLTRCSVEGGRESIGEFVRFLAL